MSATMPGHLENLLHNTTYQHCFLFNLRALPCTKNAVTKVSGLKDATWAHSVGIASGTKENKVQVVSDEPEDREKNKDKLMVRMHHTWFGSGIGVQSPVISFDGILDSWRVSL